MTVKAIVTHRALIKRINRALKKKNRYAGLKTTISERARFDLGDYYILDWRRNVITRRYIVLKNLAMELGVLKPYERLEKTHDTTHKRRKS